MIAIACASLNLPAEVNRLARQVFERYRVYWGQMKLPVVVGACILTACGELELGVENEEVCQVVGVEEMDVLIVAPFLHPGYEFE